MFDTLGYTKKLERVGFERRQAETLIRVIYTVLESNMATKRDLKELEYRLTIKLGAMTTVTVGALAAVIKFF